MTKRFERIIDPFEDRCKREVMYIVYTDNLNKTEKIINYYEEILIKKYLKVLISAASMDFLPKKQMLNSETKQVYLICTAKTPKTKIKYPHDHVRDILKQAGIPLKMGTDYTEYKKIFYSKDCQKQRENKYFNIDILR